MARSSERWSQYFEATILWHPPLYSQICNHSPNADMENGRWKSWSLTVGCFLHCCVFSYHQLHDGFFCPVFVQVILCHAKIERQDASEIAGVSALMLIKWSQRWRVVVPVTHVWLWFCIFIWAVEFGCHISRQGNARRVRRWISWPCIWWPRIHVWFLLIFLISGMFSRTSAIAESYLNLAWKLSINPQEKWEFEFLSLLEDPQMYYQGICVLSIFKPLTDWPFLHYSQTLPCGTSCFKRGAQ